MNLNGQNFGVKIDGYWNKELFTHFEGKKEQKWKRNPLPDNHEQQYSMTKLALQLNDPNSNQKYACTDSRNRPD
jgi:hypothetical protein